MGARRTGGMYLMGVAHIVLGAGGALASFATSLVCGLALVPSLVALGGPSAIEAAGRMRGLAVGLLILCLFRTIAAVVLVLAGLRVLDVAPAGRRLSHLAVYTWTMLNVLQVFILSEPLWVFALATAYPLAVEWIFLRKDWRAAFDPSWVDERAPLPPRPAKMDPAP